MQVAVADRYGNLVTTCHSTVDVTLGTHPKRAALRSPMTAAVAGGVATFDNLSLGMPGTYTFVFRLHGTTYKMTSKPIVV
jgi:hypothetical protein